MLKIGCIILTTWCALNLVASGYIILDTLLYGGHTPALNLLLSVDETDALDSKVLATIDSIAVFANSLNVAFCLAALSAIWHGLYRRAVWAYWGLCASFAAALGAGVAADFVVGTLRPDINAISGALLAVGFGSSAAGLFRRRASKELG